MDIMIDGKSFPISELYQPIYNEMIKEYKRDTQDRINTILQAEDGYNFNNMFEEDIVDWGCGLGYVSFRLSSLAKKTICGIDIDKKNIDVCNIIGAKNNISNVSFINGSVPEDIKNNVPGHVILSIIHHIQPDILLPENVLQKIRNSNIIYLELAHCNEYPEWSRKLVPKEEFISPFHYLKKLLENQLPEFTIRLIGVHSTHLGSVRPMFQCKRKIKESYNHELFSGIIYDRFKLPYIDFGDFSLNKEGQLDHGERIKKDINYAFGISNIDFIPYFLKFKKDILIEVDPYIDGLLLSNIIKFGLLPYYNRNKLKLQLVDFVEEQQHGDPHPWNFFVDSNSNLIPIDYDTKESSLCDKCIPVYLKTLIQTI